MSTQDERKLFVAGLPDSITENELRQIFEATGSKVLDVSLPRHRDTGRPRGFGFVTLSTPDEAASARSALDGSMQAGRSISVRPFQSEPPRRGEGRGPESAGGGGAPSHGPGGPGGPDRTVYVGNLPYDASASELETLITSSGGGPVVRVHLPVGPDGRARGFGFVTMGSAEAANACIVALRDVELRGRRLMVNIAHPRGSGGGGGGGGGDRPDRSGPPPSRRDDRPPPSGGDYDPSAPMPPPGMMSGKPDARRGDRWEKSAEKKKKKRRGRPDQEDPSGGRRGRSRSWEDWDED